MAGDEARILPCSNSFVTLMGGHFATVEHPICSIGSVFEERVEYITKFVVRLKKFCLNSL